MGPRDALPMGDLTRGPYPRGGARGRGVFEEQLYSGTYGVLGVQGCGFLLGPPYWLGLWLGCGFGLCRGLAILRTLAAPSIWPCSLGRRASGLMHRCVAWREQGLLTGGWDVRLGRADGVLQMQYLLGHDGKHVLGRMQGVGRVCGPGEEPVPGACHAAAHVGRVATGVARPRGCALRGEGAPWCPLCRVHGVVQRFPGRLWGVGDAGGGPQAVPAAWGGRYLVVGGKRCRPCDFAVVAQRHFPRDIPVFEDVYFGGGRGSVHCVPADELDGADHKMGFRGRLHVEDLVDVLGGRSRAGGVLRPPGLEV